MEARQPSKLYAAEPVSPLPAKMQANANEMEEVCPVCITAFGRDVEIAITPCGHKFDTTCIRKCLVNDEPHCPVCRESISRRNIGTIPSPNSLSHCSETPNKEQEELNRRFLNAIQDNDEIAVEKVMKEGLLISAATQKTLNLRLLESLERVNNQEQLLLFKSGLEIDEETRGLIFDRAKQALKDLDFCYLLKLPHNLELGKDETMQELLQGCWLEMLSSIDFKDQSFYLNQLGLKITDDSWQRASVELEKAYMVQNHCLIEVMQTNGVKITPERVQEINKTIASINEEIREALINHDYSQLERLTKERVCLSEDNQHTMKPLLADAIKDNDFYRLKILRKTGIEFDLEITHRLDVELEKAIEDLDSVATILLLESGAIATPYGQLGLTVILAWSLSNFDASTGFEFDDKELRCLINAGAKLSEKHLINLEMIYRSEARAENTGNLEKIRQLFEILKGGGMEVSV
ncbi:MAG: RING finger protein [Endozoicomonas sp.]